MIDPDSEEVKFFALLPQNLWSNSGGVLMKNIDNFIVKFLYYILGLLMFTMVVVVSAQVISRYVFGSPFTWTEEIGRYTFIWMTFLGMALGVKKMGHIAIDLLLKKLTGTAEKLLQLLINILIAAFGLAFTISGIKLMEIGSGQSSPSLGLPMEMVYVVMPISGILILYFVIGNIVQDLRGKDETVS